MIKQTQNTNQPNKAAQHTNQPDKPAQKKRGRRARLDDIKKNERGEYEYQGAQYVWADGAQARRQALMQLLALTVLLTAAVLAAGSIPAPGARDCWYLVLPCAAEVVAAVSICVGLVRLWLSGAVLKEYAYEVCTARLPGRAALLTVFALLAAAGEIIYVAGNGAQGAPALAALLTALELAAAAAAFRMRAVLLGISLKKQ